MKVFKYPLDFDPFSARAIIEVTGFSRLLTVAQQDERYCVWAEADPRLGRTKLEVEIVPTGAELPVEDASGITGLPSPIRQWMYLGTVHSQDGGTNLVFHFYWRVLPT